MRMKAVALMSGGLDSTLAAKIIKEQGVEIAALNFKTAFCLCDRKASSGCINAACRAADNLGIELSIVNVTDEFLKIVENPKHGYGSNMNPCIDCRILKFRKAKEFMRKAGASFIITGEILGQRPMSQHRQALNIIDKESGLEGLVLRPLSAKLFPETIPEKQGWVRRDRLLDFSGRTRRPQIALADELGINDYPCPAGGCLLTDPQFARKTRDLLISGELSPANVELLKIGRHFRLSPKAKLIVGRNEGENGRIFNLAKEDDYLLMPKDIAGPTCLGRGLFDEGTLKLSCQVACRYCDLNGTASVDIVYRKIPDTKGKVFKASPIEDAGLDSLRI